LDQASCRAIATKRKNEITYNERHQADLASPGPTAFGLLSDLGDHAGQRRLPGHSSDSDSCSGIKQPHWAFSLPNRTVTRLAQVRRPVESRTAPWTIGLRGGQVDHVRRRSPLVPRSVERLCARRSAPPRRVQVVAGHVGGDVPRRHAGRPRAERDGARAIDWPKTSSGRVARPVGRGRGSPRYARVRSRG